MRRGVVVSVTAAVLLVLALGCGGGDDGGSGGAKPKTVTVERQVTVEQPTSDGSTEARTGLDAKAIYRRESPGVVTVLSIFESSSGVNQLFDGGQNRQGVGSGFVLDRRGEVATNAHVVTNGEGNQLRRARQVFVQFADGNQVEAKIVGADPNVDVALIRIDPKGLDLRPVPLGSSTGLVVGDPVAAIGSPFNEPQSLSLGVISGLNRTIDSLAAGNFKIAGAIQTDAAINHGNSGGPLLDGAGRVLGINAQIQSTGGGGEGVGFAVPVNSVKRSLGQLRRKGRADYAFLGVSTATIYPQLAARFKLPADHGAWVQDVTAGGPAAKAGLHSGSGAVRFQASAFKTGGDVIVAVDGQALRRGDDLSQFIALHAPGDTVSLEVYAGKKRKIVKVKLGSRPTGGG
jgi:S1-C subfamily serine protease